MVVLFLNEITGLLILADNVQDNWTDRGYKFYRNYAHRRVQHSCVYLRECESYYAGSYHILPSLVSTLRCRMLLLGGWTPASRTTAS